MWHWYVEHGCRLQSCAERFQHILVYKAKCVWLCVSNPLAEVVAGTNVIFTRWLLVCLHLLQPLISNLVAPLLHHVWAQSKSLDLRRWRWTNIECGFEMTFLLQSILEPLKLGWFEILWQKKKVFPKEKKKCEETLPTLFWVDLRVGLVPLWVHNRVASSTGGVLSWYKI